MMADDSTNEELTTIPIPSPGQDYYTVLGVSHDATDKQIAAAHKKLSLKYHPDRNPDDDEAKIIHQLVTTAYQTLSDNDKRKKYDQNLLGGHHQDGDNKAAEDDELGDKSSASSLTKDIGRVFGKALQRLSLKGTTLSAEMLEVSQQIARNGDLDSAGPPLDPRIVDLPFGWPYEAKVDRQVSAHYRITLDDNHIHNGFFIRCKSPSKGRFRVMLLDKEGKLLFQEEGHRGTYDHNATEVTFFFTNFPTNEFVEATSVSAAPVIPSPTSSTGTETVNEFGVAPVTEKDPLPIFQRLRSFVPTKKTLAKGQYLLTLYGENLIGKSTISILIAQSNNQLNEVRDIQEVDGSINESKLSIDHLKNEYLQAKAAFELATKKINAEADRIESLITSRELAYKDFLDKSANVYSPADATSPNSPSSSSSSSSSIPPSGMLATLTSAAATTIFSATTVAASALSVAASSMRRDSVSDHDKDEQQSPSSNSNNNVSAPLEDSTGTSTTPSTSSTASAVNAFFSTSKAAVSTATTSAASTASVASGWFAKHISAVGTTFGKQGTASTSNTAASPSVTSTIREVNEDAHHQQHHDDTSKQQQQEHDVEKHQHHEKKEEEEVVHEQFAPMSTPAPTFAVTDDGDEEEEEEANEEEEV